MTVLRRSILSLVLFGALAVPCVTYAEFWGGYELKELVDAYDRTDIGNAPAIDYQDAAHLGGFVVGVHDALEGVLICTPNQVKVGQLIGIVKKYVRDNPDKWNRPASTLVVNALSSAFPCER